MSLGETCGWTLLRSLVVALLALPVAALLAARLRETVGRNIWLWAALLIPWLTPELLTAYAYRNFSLSLIHHPHANELLYACLLLFHVAPVGTIVLYFAPPSPLTREALHVRRLSGSFGRPGLRGWLSNISWTFRGPKRALVPAFALMALIGFQQVQLPSLMQAISWGVWLFDAHVLLGLILSETLRYAALPWVIQIVLLLPIAWFITRPSQAESEAGGTMSGNEGTGGAARIFAAAYLMAAIAAMLAIPLWLIAGGFHEGAIALARSTPMWQGLLREVSLSMLFGGLAALIVRLAGSRLMRRTAGGFRWRGIAALVLAIPGLMGPLILGLCLQAFFQQPPLARLSDSPVPLLLGLCLFLWPRAVLLSWLVQSQSQRDGLFLAELLGRSQHAAIRRNAAKLIWILRARRETAAFCLLFHWGYLSLTLPTLLAPVRVQWATVRLYEQMHFSRTGMLSVMTVAAVSVPLLVFGALLLGAPAFLQSGNRR